MTRALTRAPSLPRRALAPLAYLLLACLGHAGAFRGLSTQTPCRCEDAPQTDWFLAWTPWAVAQGRSPFFTDHLVAPDGVNLMWNTLMPLPALLAWPVTALLGPVASHTLLAVLAFAGSATAMWWAVRRFAPWWPARFAAGLLYGFSPYLVAQGTGHLNLSLVMIPPLVLVLLDELLVRRRRRAVVAGLALGAVTAAQLLVTEEVLASLLVMCVVGLVVLLVQQRHRVTWAATDHALVGLFVAAATLFSLTAWPLSEQFAGERVVTEPVQDTGRYAADVLGVVVPTVNQWLGSDVSTGWAVNVSENGSYLGAGLLLLLAALRWRLRRDPVVRWAVATGVAAWVLSLGERLHLGGTSYDVPLPYLLVSRLPVVHNLSAPRFSLYVVLCAAVVVAVALDRARFALTSVSVPTPQRLARKAAVLVVAAAVVVPLVPAWPYSFEPTRTPSYFTSDAVQRVPDQSTALLFPLPRFPATAPMLWQAEAGFRFKLLGGYVITPRGDGHGTFVGGRTRIEEVFAAASAGRPLPTAVPRYLRETISAELGRIGVRSVLVATGERGGPELVRWLTLLLERGPDESVGGVTAWYDVVWPEPLAPTGELPPRALL